jgi:hypothetical protein
LKKTADIVLNKFRRRKKTMLNYLKNYSPMPGVYINGKWMTFNSKK